MKKIRIIASAALLSVTALGAVTLSSCTKEDCAIGYEGSDCTTEIREQMIGTFNATDVDNSTGTPYTYTPVVSKNNSVTVVNIANFGDFFTNTELVTSNVTKSGNTISFSIPAQKPDNIYTVTGSGQYDVSTKKVTITYSLDNGVSIKNYTGTWTKQ
ncbi:MULTISPECIES: hypothetical protein [Edaphocola]|jgi:hypothetical protein|uniref:hypothetical protein n=1 Tax=Edaphocola TaxID=2601681 RepID=UPI000FBDCD7E|nr:MULTISPECIES: hypothetical protein [Edaphocola]